MAVIAEGKRVRVLNRKLIPLKRLKNAAHNPPSRIDPKFLKELIDSLDLIGQLHPITVTPQDVIIDGHRRWKARPGQAGWGLSPDIGRAWRCCCP